MIIKMRDYELIYKTINSILLNEKADPTVACIIFAHYGAQILNQHYKLQAVPVGGLCMYHLGGESNVLGFGGVGDGQVYSDEDNYHCWVMVDDWLIDFMAPEFPQLLKNQGSQYACPSQMMQKPLSEMVSSPDDLKSPGDFFCDINEHVIAKAKETLSTSLAYSDLAEICSKWFRKPPKKMQKAIGVADGKGSLNKVTLTGRKLVGAW